MPSAQFHLISPEQVADFARAGCLNEALAGIAGLAHGALSVGNPSECESQIKDSHQAVDPHAPPSHERPILYNGKTLGRILYAPNGDPATAERAAGAMGSVLEHAVGREIAVADLAEALMTNYEELNMLYSLLPNIATRVREEEIGMALVEQTAETLSCRRVSLLVLDENQKELRVLASRGLPPELKDVPIPVSGSIAGRTLGADDFLVVSDISQRPDLGAASPGSYDTNAFAVIRVPLQARGQAVGVLTATERVCGAEFTARDCKLLEGLSAMGASALMNCRLHAEVRKQMFSTIQALASAVDAKDQYTHDHSGRVAQLCVATAQKIGMRDIEALRKVELAGLLHDIGKIGVPDAILSKSGHLTPDEYETIKKHVSIGASIVENVQGLKDVAEAILRHHERHDGLGYPGGLTGVEIPMASKLISVADAFDSLTSDRPYRKRIPTEAALSELNRYRGTQFDPVVLDAFNDVARSSGS